jgi:hypothetical protein
MGRQGTSFNTSPLLGRRVNNPRDIVECNFSFIWFHSKRRNRLAAKKVFYSAEAKRSVQRKDEEEELAEMNRRCLDREQVKKRNTRLRLVNPDERTKRIGLQYSEIRVADAEPVLPDANELEVIVLCAFTY